MKVKRTRLDPCPNRACAGQLRVPVPVTTVPVTVSCTGLFTHTYDVRLLTTTLPALP